MSLLEAEILAVKILKQVMEDKINEQNAQLAVVVPDTGFQVYNEAQLREVILKCDPV